ncbi:HD domain-containing protein [Mycobacterium montefiorense]|uniref:HD domain-containing protein n=1 Tax=Mycobacterium montefiorense TaxID=154654 RepID=UPI0021F31633|nr:HD domain-containing protein [Mycobacterium montefiorense]MCV7429534.1 HD domain-containing protein [Mycobacterium montefiorense]GLE53823.1 phosphohydrolase [Mycobacterium montefiorense]
MTLTRETLAMLIDGLAGLPYGREVVDQRAHALQTGWYAKQAGADDELLLAATLHDIGKAKVAAAQWPDLPHELCGAEFARTHFSERAAWIIGAHVPAKRYLVATDPGYHAHLSPASVASLKLQGGGMSELEIADFRANPGADEAVMVRRWDDNAKDPHGPVITIAEVLDAYDRLIA